MKKSIFILAALCAATFANAQITLEKTYNGALYPFTYTNSGFLQKYIYGDLYIEYLQDYQNPSEDYTIVIHDAYSYDELTRFTTPKGKNGWFITTRGYFSNSNEVITLLSQNGHLVLISESGELFQDLGEFDIDNVVEMPQILTLSDRSCKLWFIVRGGYNDVTGEKIFSTYIYSLPGNGKVQSVSTPSSPKRSARKIAREGQVLVETESNTFTLQGQEMK